VPGDPSEDDVRIILISLAGLCWRSNADQSGSQVTR
jgi:hypothetical protein